MPPEALMSEPNLLIWVEGVYLGNPNAFPTENLFFKQYPFVKWLMIHQEGHRKGEQYETEQASVS